MQCFKENRIFSDASSECKCLESCDIDLFLTALHAASFGHSNCILHIPSGFLVPQVIDLPDQDLATISIPVDDSCAGGCEVLIHINIPRQNRDVANPLAIPTSIYNDPAMPHTVTLRDTFTVEQVGCKV